MTYSPDVTLPALTHNCSLHIFLFAIPAAPTRSTELWGSLSDGLTLRYLKYLLHLWLPQRILCHNVVCTQGQQPLYQLGKVGSGGREAL